MRICPYAKKSVTCSTDKTYDCSVCGFYELKEFKETKIIEGLTASEILEKFEEPSFIMRICYRIINWYQDTKLNIYAFFQRGKRGWAYSDTWDFDHYIAKVISSGLRYYKKDMHGHPDDFTEKRWEKVIDNIIFAFDYHINERGEKGIVVSTRRDTARYTLGKKQFIKYLDFLWD